jgi:glycosyltransferase involved in cell wall biosynthesis
MTQSKPVLLYVVNHARWFLTHRLPLARAARDAGYEVHVASPPGPDVEGIEREGFEWHSFPLTIFRRNPFGDLFTIVTLTRLYRALRPALVHHVTLKPVMYGTVAARFARVPYVINAIVGLGDAFAAGTSWQRVSRAIWMLLLRATIRHPRMRVIFQNPDDRDVLVRANVVKVDDTVLIKGAGVDPAIFAPITRDPSPDITVCYVGRITVPKGLNELSEAARALKSPHLRFVVAGEADPIGGHNIPPPTIAGWARDGIIDYVGRRDDVASLLREADIFCSPSYEIEGIPKALLEAASCALPIVTTDTPGCREIVRDGDNGFLVPPRDVPSLVRALKTLIDDPALRARMGARGRERVLEEFAVDRVVSRTLEVYRELVSP